LVRQRVPRLAIITVIIDSIEQIYEKAGVETGHFGMVSKGASMELIQLFVDKIDKLILISFHPQVVPLVRQQLEDVSLDFT